VCAGFFKFGREVEGVLFWLDGVECEVHDFADAGWSEAGALSEAGEEFVPCDDAFVKSLPIGVAEYVVDRAVAGRFVGEEVRGNFVGAPVDEDASDVEYYVFHRVIIRKMRARLKTFFMLIKTHENGRQKTDREKIKHFRRGLHGFGFLRARRNELCAWRAWFLLKTEPTRGHDPELNNILGSCPPENADSGGFGYVYLKHPLSEFSGESGNHFISTTRRALF